MLTLRFWRDAFERAVATAAQAALAVLIVGDNILNAMQADWRTAGGVAAGAAVLSVLKSLVATQVGDPESASLADIPPGPGRRRLEP